MRVHVLIGLVAACSLSPWSSASAQSFITTRILDTLLNVAPGEEVIVREREYIIRRRPVLSDPVPGSARAGGIVPTGTLTL